MKRMIITCGLLLPAICFADPAKPAPKPAPKAPEAAKAPSFTESARFEVGAPSGHPIKHLKIENPLGNVRVEGYDGTALQIETTKEAPDEDTLHRLRLRLVPNPDGSVRITATADGGPEVRPVPRGAVHIDVLVRAPRDTQVEAVASAGALEEVNMDAGGDLDTASGPISVRNVSGEVSTHSVSGTTKLAQVFGSVDAQSLSADVDLDTIGGDRLVASSAGHGKIAGRRVRVRDVELTTTDGKIVLEAEASLRGRLVVSSLHGDVDVHLHHRGAVTVRVHGGGKVDLGPTAMVQPQGGGWSQAQFGTGEHPAAVELRSSYGNLMFSLIE